METVYSVVNRVVKNQKLWFQTRAQCVSLELGSCKNLDKYVTLLALVSYQ